MSEIDSAAFEAGEAPCNFSQDNLSASGSSTAAHFSDPLGRVYVTARARLLSARPQAGHTQPALTLVVEDSADASSWATVATFDFTASDQQSAAVDSPRAYLRASWADVVGTWAVDVAVKSIATPASGGGSMPAGDLPRAVYDTPYSALDVPANTRTALDFGVVISGDEILDLTDPTAPTFLAEAVYAVTATVNMAEPNDIDCVMQIEMEFDPDNVDADFIGRIFLPAGMVTIGRYQSVSGTYYSAAGGLITVNVRHNDNINHDFGINMALQRVA